MEQGLSSGDHECAKYISCPLYFDTILYHLWCTSENFSFKFMEIQPIVSKILYPIINLSIGHGNILI